MPQTRLDQLLVERGIADSLDRARRLIYAGQVVAGEHRIDKPGARIDPATPVRLKGGEPGRYVSRGGDKLAGALTRFGFGPLNGLTALDVGASTGGFTDCLLQHGAARVWAVDTGRGRLHQRLVTDPRVRLLENANARHMTPDWFEGDRIALAAVDVSFISLRLILPALTGVLAPGGCVAALVKPQFEAAPGDVGEGGVVRDRAVHRRALEDVARFADQNGWRPLGLCASPLAGPAGNVEFFLLLDRASAPSPRPACADLAIEPVLNAAYTELKSSGGAPISSAELHDSTPGDAPT